MRKLFSIEQILHKLDPLAMKASGLKIYILSLVHHIEDSWAKDSTVLLLIQALHKAILTDQESAAPMLHEHCRLSRPLAYPSTLTLSSFIAVAVSLERQLDSPAPEHSLAVAKENHVSPFQSKRALGLSLIAENIRSALNVGSLFRVCECVGADHLYLTGYTATPKQVKVARSALGSEARVPWSWHPNAATLLNELQDQEVSTFALETTTPSHSLYEYSFAKPCALAVGNERYGLSKSVLKNCGGTIRIPIFGVKHSLNVAICGALALYEIRRQWGEVSLSSKPQAADSVPDI